MRILSHYFAARYLGLFSMVLAIAFLVIATVEFVLNLDDISSFGADPAAASSSASSPSSSSFAAAVHVLRYLGIRLTAYYLADLMPIASFIAVFITFALAGRAMERNAIEAGGIPPVRIILPVLATALILSFAAAILHETVILRAEQIWSGERAGAPDEINFGREAFWLRKGPTITNVSHADPESRTLFGVEIFERGPGGSVVRVIRAAQVHIAMDGRWHVVLARIWRFDPRDPSVDPVYEVVDSVVLDLASLRGDQLLGADPALLPVRDLGRYLASDPPLTSSTLRRLETRYHERLSRPWLIFVFAWLALPFALRIDARGHTSGPAAAAVATLALFFLVETAGRTLAQQALVPIGITPWLVMGIFGLGASLAVPSANRAR